MTMTNPVVAKVLRFETPTNSSLKAAVEVFPIPANEKSPLSFTKAYKLIKGRVSVFKNCFPDRDTAFATVRDLQESGKFENINFSGLFMPFTNSEGKIEILNVFFQPDGSRSATLPNWKTTLLKKPNHMAIFFSPIND